MLASVCHGKDGPLIVMLHWLGGSARSWDGVAAGLQEAGFRAVALDLPGFGSSAGGYSVEAMAAQVLETVQTLKPDGPWLLCGHSMGGKVAAVIAQAGCEGLAGLVLVSPSPVSPEPMSEGQREDLLRSLGAARGDVTEDRKRAAKFIEDNTGKLAIEDLDVSIADVLRMDRRAFAAWLSDGSKEDWAERVGILTLPALVLAGTEEEPLGFAEQKKLTMPRFPAGILVVLEGCGHLAPLERPFEIADRITAFARQVGLAPAPRGLGEKFRTLVESPLTSPQTRSVMEARLKEPDQSFFSADEMLTLRALVRRIVPGAGFDVAARVDPGKRDGWRFDMLPEDGSAWRRGLRSLEAAARRKHGVPFSALAAGMQDELLQSARDGELGKGLLGMLHVGEPVFSGAEMQRWFEDARAEITRIYIADPRTMERIGFHGFADEAGFTRIQLAEVA